MLGSLPPFFFNLHTSHWESFPNLWSKPSYRSLLHFELHMVSFFSGEKLVGLVLGVLLMVIISI